MLSITRLRTHVNHKVAIVFVIFATLVGTYFSGAIALAATSTYDCGAYSAGGYGACSSSSSSGGAASTGTGTGTTTTPTTTTPTTTTPNTTDNTGSGSQSVSTPVGATKHRNWWLLGFSILAILAALGLIIFLLWRRRNKDDGQLPPTTVVRPPGM